MLSMISSSKDVVYKLICAGCNACYVGETVQHFSTRMKEHLTSARASHIFSDSEASKLVEALIDEIFAVTFNINGAH